MFLELAERMSAEANVRRTLHQMFHCIWTVGKVCDESRFQRVKMTAGTPNIPFLRLDLSTYALSVEMHMGNKENRGWAVN